MEFPTIQSVIDHIKSIPANKFCINTIDDHKGHHCVIGHLNIAVRGLPSYAGGRRTDKDYNKSHDAIGLLYRLGVSMFALAVSNNNDTENPKRGAIKYLESLIK